MIAVATTEDDLAGRVEAMLAPPSRIDGTFDVVLANIARAGIVELASELVSRVSPGGWLAAGGISPSQCSQVVGFLHPLVEVGRRTFGEWSTVVLARKRLTRCKDACIVL